MTNKAILFDETSLYSGAYSLKVFSFRTQATITAVGLAPDDIITFEVLDLAAGARSELYCCFISPADVPTVSAVEPMVCYDCDDTGSTLIRLTVDNPIVVLNAPQNALIRAHYTGSGFGSARVWAELETTTSHLLPGQSGCICDECIPDPDSWRETGPRRCAGGSIEGLMVNNCGDEEWRVVGSPTWQDTGQTRCNNGNVEMMQQNECGETQWVNRGAPTWQDTGTTQCNNGRVEMLQDNACGDTRWDDRGPAVWRDAGETRCNGNNVQKKQINDCGGVQWVNDGTATWVDTGVTRCVNNAEESKQENECGQTRWHVTGRSCGFIPTYPLPCGGSAFRPGEQPTDATVEIKGCSTCDDDDDVVAYVYPTPREGASTPVYDGCNTDSDCGCVGDGEVIGYAVDKTLPNPCRPRNVNVKFKDYLGIFNKQGEVLQVAVSGRSVEALESIAAALEAILVAINNDSCN